MSYHRILHATDLQKEHFKLCEQAKAFAKAHHAVLYFMHVIEVPSSLILAQSLGFMELILPAQEDAKTVLNTIASALSIPKDHLFVEIGSVKQHVTEKAKALQCDLILIGNTMNQGFTLGSTGCQIAQHLPCDLLIMR